MTLLLDFICRGYSLKKLDGVIRKIVLLNNGNWRILLFAQNDATYTPRGFLHAACYLLNDTLIEINSTQNDFDIRWNICVKDNDQEYHDFSVTANTFTKNFPCLTSNELISKIEDRFGQNFVRFEELELNVKFKL